MSDDKEIVGSRVERFDVGDDRQLTRSEIAKETGLTKQAIDKRIASGKRGSDLLESNKPREAKGSWVAQRWAEAEARGLTPEEQRVKARCDPRLLPSGACAYDYVADYPDL
jgi:hypothetical protein